MTWNYYQYNILRIKNEFDYEVMEECGENIEDASKAIADIRRECPNDKFVIQSIHCVARLVKEIATTETIPGKLIYRGNVWDIINENGQLADGTPAIFAERLMHDSTYQTSFFVRKQNGKYKRVNWCGKKYYE